MIWHQGSEEWWVYTERISNLCLNWVLTESQKKRGSALEAFCYVWLNYLNVLDWHVWSVKALTQNQWRLSAQLPYAVSLPAGAELCCGLMGQSGCVSVWWISVRVYLAIICTGTAFSRLLGSTEENSDNFAAENFSFSRLSLLSLLDCLYRHNKVPGWTTVRWVCVRMNAAAEPHTHAGLNLQTAPSCAKKVVQTHSCISEFAVW